MQRKNCTVKPKGTAAMSCLKGQCSVMPKDISAVSCNKISLYCHTKRDQHAGKVKGGCINTLS